MRRNDGRTEKANTKCPLAILWRGHKNKKKNWKPTYTDPISNHKATGNKHIFLFGLTFRGGGEAIIDLKCQNMVSQFIIVIINIPKFLKKFAHYFPMKSNKLNDNIMAENILCNNMQWNLLQASAIIFAKKSSFPYCLLITDVLMTLVTPSLSRRFFCSPQTKSESTCHHRL